MPPSFDASVIEPRVTSTWSSGPTAILGRFAAAHIVDVLDDGLAFLLPKAEISDARVHLEFHAALVEPFVQRPDHESY